MMTRVPNELIIEVYIQYIEVKVLDKVKDFFLAKKYIVLVRVK